MLRLQFDIKFSLFIFFGFIVFTIIGTLTHELGHIAVAKSLGYDTSLSYGSMSYNRKGFAEHQLVKEYNKLYDEYEDVEFEDVPDSVKNRFNEIADELQELFPDDPKHSILVTMGGPAQTILTSILGLTILYFRRRKYKVMFSKLDWLAVFLALFMLREIFNFVTAVYSSVIHSKSNFNGDEFRISRYLEFNEWVIPSLTLIMGLAVAYYVILEVIPRKFRLSFLIAGFLGGIVGFILWFKFLGPLLF